MDSNTASQHEALGLLVDQLIQKHLPLHENMEVTLSITRTGATVMGTTGPVRPGNDLENLYTYVTAPTLAAALQKALQ